MGTGVALANAGYPIIFVFHDYDIYRNGAAWLRKHMALLNRRRIKRWVSMETLGAMLMAKLRVVRDGDHLHVTLDFSDSPGTKTLPGTIPLKIEGGVSTINVNGQERPLGHKQKTAERY